MFRSELLALRSSLDSRLKPVGVDFGNGESDHALREAPPALEKVMLETFEELETGTEFRREISTFFHAAEFVFRPQEHCEAPLKAGRVLTHELEDSHRWRNQRDAFDAPFFRSAPKTNPGSEGESDERNRRRLPEISLPRAPWRTSLGSQAHRGS